MSEDDIRSNQPLTAIVNVGSPELNVLAASLSRKHLLHSYIRPFVRHGRWWEQLLSNLPIAGNLIDKAIGRRILPGFFDYARLSEAGVMEDFVLALARRLFNAGLPVPRNVFQYLSQRIDTKVVRNAYFVAHDAHVIVANQGLGLELFKREQIRRVLNYPIAHHAIAKEVLDAEAIADPEFASMSTNMDYGNHRAAYYQRVDQEIKLADIVLVGSRFAKASFLSAGVDETKVQVVNYGVDLNLFHPRSQGMATRPFTALFVGSVDQRKGVGYLLRAFKKLKSKDMRLLVVGNIRNDATPLSAYLDVFEHRPNVPRSQLAKIYREADIFILPTLLEGLPLVVLEAMASGLPAIVTATGADDIVRSGIDGLVIQTRSVDAIVEAVVQVRDDRELLMAMSRNAQERANHFSWDIYCKKVLEKLQIEVAPQI